MEGGRCKEGEADRRAAGGPPPPYLKNWPAGPKQMMDSCACCVDVCSSRPAKQHLPQAGAPAKAPITPQRQRQRGVQRQLQRPIMAPCTGTTLLPIIVCGWPDGWQAKARKGVAPVGIR